VDKNQPPELRHTVLAQVAFHDLQAMGLEAFLSQNNGEGWRLPETLRLSDCGLGHDDRAKTQSPSPQSSVPAFCPDSAGARYSEAVELPSASEQISELDCASG